jgi:hypothetical protein
MSSANDRPLEERLSPTAAEFFTNLTSAEQDEVVDRITQLRVDPEVDGEEIFEVETAPARWRVAVDPNFLVYFRVDGDTLLVDSIIRTDKPVKNLLNKRNMAQSKLSKR